MTGRERVHAAIAGQPVDRIPVALWRHFPMDDQQSDSLAAAHIAFQQRYEWDFLKVTPANGFWGEDWGLRAAYHPNRLGLRHYTELPVTDPSDWLALENLDVSVGAYGRELRAVRLMREALPSDLLLMTVLSPLGIARTLSGDQALVRHLREASDDLRRGLEIITDVTARFATAALEAGADGIFFLAHCASTEYLTVEEYLAFGRPYDLRILEASTPAEVRLLHLHGTGIMFDALADYPVDILHWHDRHTAPTLAEARSRYSGCLAGGLNGWETLSSGTPADIVAEIRDAVTQTGGTRFIVASGCTIPIDIPDDRVLTVRTATMSGR